MLLEIEFIVSEAKLGPIQNNNEKLALEALRNITIISLYPQLHAIFGPEVMHIVF